MMSYARTAIRLLPALAALGLVACGPNLRDFEEVAQAFEAPTGVLSSQTAPAVLGQSQSLASSADLSDTASVFDQTGTLGLALSTVGQALGSSRQNLLVDGCGTHVKLTQDFGPEKITVDCSENTDPTGKLVLEFVYDGGNEPVAIYVRFQEWCAEGDCIDGWFGWTTEVDAAAGEGMTQTFMVVANLTLTEASGETHEVEWALRHLQSATAVGIEYLVYVTEDGTTGSFVLSATATEEGGSLSIRARSPEGEQVEVTCTYTAGSESGECVTADGTTTVSWSTGG